MTAEVAIINRSAVALATDSAVTLRVRGSEKVYNSADKLFELSTRDPIGIMIYNNLEFMGISLEVAIKQFRDHAGAKHYNSVVEASEAFFMYLTNECSGDGALQKVHAKALLFPAIAALRTDWSDAVEREYVDKHKKTDFPGILTSKIKERIDSYDDTSAAEGFENTTEAEIYNIYADAFDEIRDDFFSEFPLTDTHKDSINRLCYLILTKDRYSNSLTGMVFAGFGETDQFPSLISYEVDGIILNKLKKRQVERVVTSRTEITGEILPFAQREMVDRFLYGIDPEFEEGIEKYIELAISTTFGELIKSLPKTTAPTRRKLARGVQSATKATLAAWRDKMVPSVKERFKRQVQDMIFLMPKQELSNLAKELINLTSVKRKFSGGKETVGGPIDIAVISRIDGFVWVQRKHYFTPELNPRYFVRKFGVPKVTGDGS